MTCAKAFQDARAGIIKPQEHAAICLKNQNLISSELSVLLRFDRTSGEGLFYREN